jgi:hypothetical protein
MESTYLLVEMRNVDCGVYSWDWSGMYTVFLWL